MKFLHISPNDVISAEQIKRIQQSGSELYILMVGDTTASRVIDYSDSASAAAALADIIKQLK